MSARARSIGVPSQAHLEIPAGGIAVGRRRGRNPGYKIVFVKSGVCDVALATN
jgi:hypothetical protein